LNGVQSDESLAQRLQQGDIQDLQLLVERYHGPLLGYLYRLTGGDEALAQDLVQETFLRVLHSIDLYQYPRRFKPWLYTIATNLGRDHYKRLATRQSVPMPDSIIEQADNRLQAVPEAFMIAQDEATRVKTALLQLPDLQREAIMLRYYQGLALVEIAQVLSVPVGTVKSRLSLGLKRLQSLLGEEN
jgi:RNA polymerase sigma-70 factor (ECF subfamily)